jgi:hypothetical protein
VSGVKITGYLPDRNFAHSIIGYGVIGLKRPALKDVNNSIRKELSAQHFRKVKLDNFTQYTPSLSVYERPFL